jgi:hypothetical protein
MNKLILNLIVFIHFLFILFVVLVPFIGSNYLLVIYVIIIPFMCAHWIVNDNNCALTLIEKSLRKKIYGYEPKPHECISYKIIAPIYDFTKNNYSLSNITYIITIGLWLIGIHKIYSNYKNGKLRNFRDFIKN